MQPHDGLVSLYESPETIRRKDHRGRAQEQFTHMTLSLFP
jgi:hypothetical protein